MADHVAPLRAVLDQVMQDADMPRPVRITAADAHDATDHEAVLGRAAKVIIALDDFAELAKARAKAMRDALLTVMVETGDPGFSIGSHTIGYSETARVRVTDPALIPQRFMVIPEPAPDAGAIRAALKGGETIPGATMSNAAPSLFIRARTRK